MKTLLSFLILSPLILSAGSAFYQNNSLVIESSESKNKDLNSVFNEIRWLPGKSKDVWMMNQSHHGRFPGAAQWDRLAIVIDKTKSPKTAKFYQLKPGPLVWSEDLIQEQVPYSVSCFICHNNGPRSVRPSSESQQAALSWQDQLRLQVWNTRIKTYGRIQYDPIHDDNDKNLIVPFRFHDLKANLPLQVPVCLHCHKEEGFLARGLLRQQQAGTIFHAVKTGHMPPPGFVLSTEEKLQLENFIFGF